MNKRVVILAVIVLLLIAALLPIGLVQAQAGNQWQVDFFPNLDWAGYPVYSFTTPQISFNWNNAPPGPNMPNERWTMRANTTAFFYAGVNRFQVTADDEVAIFVDGIQYLDTRGRKFAGKTVTTDVPLTQGMHQVRVDFRQRTGPAYIFFTWFYLKPDGPTPAPPPRPLPYPTPPASASSVTTQYGNFTPCIQQHTHQANCFGSNGNWDSPNVGSIQMEPQITIWGNCSPPDSDVKWVVDPSARPPVVKSFRCSKSLAGWFPTD